MGARGSTPKVVHIDNPNLATEKIEVSPEVAQRLSDARTDFIAAQNTLKENIKEEEETVNVVDVKYTFNKLFVDLEKEEFDKTKEYFDNRFEKPVQMPKQYTREISKMRENIISCYKHNAKQSLICHQLIHAFEDFVYKEQLNHIVKMKHERDIKRAKEQLITARESASGDTFERKPGSCGAYKGRAGENPNSSGIKVGGDCGPESDL